MDELSLPSGFRFECLMCGDCCGGWDIPVSEESKKRVEGLDWRVVDSRLSGKNFFCKALKDADFKWVLAKGADDACVFLEDGKCLIHKVAGYEAKDLTCRQYPATFMKTPSGVCVGFSFACRSIRENSGRPVSEYASEYEALWDEMKDERKSRDISLAAGVKLSWSAYELLEDAFTRLILDTQGSLSEGICACTRIAAHLTAKTGKAKLDVGDVEAAASGAYGFRGKMAIDAYFPKRQRIVLGFSVIPHAEKEGKLKDALNAVTYYNRFVKGAGRVKLKNLGEVNLSGLADVEFKPEETKTKEFLVRYFTHFLFRKSLLVEPSVADNLKLMATGYALTRFYALAHAQKRGSSDTEYEDVANAVGCVDRYFLLHSTLSKTLLSNKKTEFLLRKFIDQPDYVDCMLYEKPFTLPA
ncbi:MAG: YkgJ family cysteine cluster protein [Candidatus Altiarchaeota archaeon]